MAAGFYMWCPASKDINAVVGNKVMAAFFADETACKLIRMLV